MGQTNNRIAFHFQPSEKSSFAVTKADDSGIQRRYVSGIASGPKEDWEGERMTDKCVKGFMEQANKGQVLLYPDLHGIKASEDIGILTKAEIMPNGDWFTEYRLYDEHDDIGKNKLETINNLWKQLTGAPPYKKPLQKGFSVEGLIPPDGIISAATDGAGNIIGQRVLDKVELDGVVLVPRPAYKDSVATAVYKALGEMTPVKRNHLRKGIREELQAQLREEELRDSYYRKRWDVDEALQAVIEKIMKKRDMDKRLQLELAFDEYKEVMIGLLLQSEALFVDEVDQDAEAGAYNTSSVPIVRSRRDVLKDLHAGLMALQGSLKKPTGR